MAMVDNNSHQESNITTTGHNDRNKEESDASLSQYTLGNGSGVMNGSIYNETNN
jgi:hypothetical protein